MEYTVVKATSPEEQLEIEEFVHDQFMPDCPVTHIFGLENTPVPRPTAPRVGSPEDFYLKAVTSQGQIIGVAINRFNPTFLVDSDTPPLRKKMVEFMEFVEERSKIDTLPERTIELRVLSVHNAWRQRGVAKRLTQESVRLARIYGFQTMRMCCVSAFTTKLARDLGWREHYRIAYKDYPELSKAEVSMKITPPHEHLCYFVTDLQ